MIHQSASIRSCVHQTRLCKRVQHSKKGPTSRHSGKKHTGAVPIHTRHLSVRLDSRLGSHTIPFRVGPQQGDPLSSLEFCESIQTILSELDSDLEIGFIDDLSMSSDLLTLAKDVETIVKADTRDSSLTPLSVKLSWTISPTLTTFLSSGTLFEYPRTT